MRKLGAAENHFSTTTSGQKAFICNFRHLNNHRYNISHGFGWLMGVPTNFCQTHYGSLPFPALTARCTAIGHLRVYGKHEKLPHGREIWYTSGRKRGKINFIRFSSFNPSSFHLIFRRFNVVIKVALIHPVIQIIVEIFLNPHLAVPVFEK